MVDTNCPWTPEQARIMAERLLPYELHWSKSIFPPEDFDALACLGAESGTPLPPARMPARRLSLRKCLMRVPWNTQPSVKKVGGITEMQKIAAFWRR